jgi:CubicO group peptidase (beta-lactamase class C family)
MSVRQGGFCRFVSIICLTLAAAPLVAIAQGQQPVDLTGLWQAKRHLGPEVRGTLTIDRANGAWHASIAGRTALMRMNRDSVSFQLPDGDRFVGRVNPKRKAIVGHWIQQRTASPVTLASCGSGCYRGEVVPLDQEFTFFLKITRQPDGQLGAFLRNPERNLGHRWIPVRRIAVDGSNVRLLDARDSLVLPGVIRDDVLSVYIGNRGGSYDFRRVPDTAVTNFYPRGRPTARYAYVPPRARNDGWLVGTLDEVGISRDSITALIQRLIVAPIDSATAQQTHALLIARHGKLVLEEYFYGEHADKPHDSRSASKSVLTVLIGAARHAGVKIGPETRAYSVLRPAAANLPPRKQAMTLDHLLTMSSGFDCDDSGDRPGDEDVLTDQDANPDWQRMILDLNVVRDPGEKAVYCSIQPHLAGGVLERVAGRSLYDLVWELLGEPLDMKRYYLLLAPFGDVYFGGGHRFLPRDFMKFAQLYLNGGTWRGRRILSREWIDRSIQARYPMGRANQYGYLWWMREYPYRGRTIKAYFASGNGGQHAMWIPELDLVIGLQGANYADASAGIMVGQLIPRVILPAVQPGK